MSVDIPKLMEQLPSEKDSPETLRAKMGSSTGQSTSHVPVPPTSAKYGRSQDEHTANPFGYAEDDQDHYWCVLRGAYSQTLMFLILLLS
jgi:hypothetical protein